MTVVQRPFPLRAGATTLPRLRLRLSRARLAAEAVAFVLAIGLTVWSAILVKQARTAPPLAGVYREPILDTPARLSDSFHQATDEALPTPVTPAPASMLPEPVIEMAPQDPLAGDPTIRWFNGRPVRPSKTLRMRVTAYSPDARSCGDSADGLTATLHSVETNNSELVAADPRLLPYGTMLTVPGYAGGKIVPVLDCGGKIKGNRLDVLYRTHDRAKRWGSQWLTVTVWSYADGKPAENPRKLR